MSNFNPQKLSVTYKDGVLIKEPIIPRRYTLTHSDFTGNLYLSIGKDYDYDKITKMRDEVLGTWKEKDNEKVLEIFLHLDSEHGLGALIIRDKIFRKELTLALKAIVYGDWAFFEANPELMNSNIIVHFKSKIPEYNVIESWGKVEDYKYNEGRQKEKDSQEEMLKESEEISSLLEVQSPFETISSPYHTAQTPYIHIGASHLPPSILPGANPGNPGNKYKIIEKALIIVLDSYIDKLVYKLYGSKGEYCLKKAEVLQAKEVNDTCPCKEGYEISIGLKAGKKLPIYNNLIITFFIDDDLIKIIKVKELE